MTRLQTEMNAIVLGWLGALLPVLVLHGFLVGEWRERVVEGRRMPVLSWSRKP